MKRIAPFIIGLLMVLAAGVYYFSFRTNAVLKLPTAVPNQSGPAADTTPTPGPTGSGGSAATGAVSRNNQITLTVSNPANNAAVTSPTLTVRGTTSPGAEVDVNENEVTADTAGKFSTTLTLDEGDNYISAVATDADGNAAEVELNVTYNSVNQ
jgi:hypothetical protein